MELNNIFLMMMAVLAFVILIQHIRLNFMEGIIRNQQLRIDMLVTGIQIHHRHIAELQEQQHDGPFRDYEPRPKPQMVWNNIGIDGE